MSQRPLVLVSALTVGDYLLWNWSLNANHTAIALVSGLTLPPLALASLWLAALGVARLLAHTAARRTARGERAGRSRPSITRRSAGAVAREQAATQSPQSDSPRKLAA